MKISKMKFWAILLGVFISGFIIAPSEITKTEIKKVVKEIPKEIVKEIEVCHNEDIWKELKEVDDLGFLLAGEGLEISAKAIGAVSNFDVNAIERCTEEAKAITEQMEMVGERRVGLLKELGY